MKPPPFDLARAHRWFAIELNNRAWEFIELPERTDEQTHQMIHAAHAACYHWLEAGNELNHLRAQCLLATAYARANLPEAAVRHAEQCLELSWQAGDAQSFFDRATAHGCAAVAYRLAGKGADADDQWTLALLAANLLTDPADREVFERFYSV